jgi:DNA transformation protein
VTVPIESLRNLGSKSGQCLRKAGINTIAELERLGPVVAFRLVKQHQPKASLNLLWAMVAGLKGKDWRELTETTRKRLRKEADEELATPLSPSQNAFRASDGKVLAVPDGLVLAAAR